MNDLRAVDQPLDFDEVADQLYGVLPAEFVARRAGFVAQAKANGDKELATRIGALRKPNTAAWLVNLLVREAAGQIESLLELGAAMRKAQSRLSAEDLRRLGQQRQQVVRALATQAHGLASDLGENVSRDALHQVADTLQAGLADPDLAAQVRQGRLTNPLSYSGFGPAGLQVVTPRPDPQAPEEEDHAEAEAAAEHERRLAEAKAGVDVAARAVVRSQRGLVTAKETLSRADRELARAEQLLAERQAALAEAESSADRARDRMAQANQAQQQAEDSNAEALEALRIAKRTLRELGEDED